MDQQPESRTLQIIGLIFIASETLFVALCSQASAPDYKHLLNFILLCGNLPQLAALVYYIFFIKGEQAALCIGFTVVSWMFVGELVYRIFGA